MDRPARTLSGSLMHRVLSHVYVWAPIMAPDSFFCPTEQSAQGRSPAKAAGSGAIPCSIEAVLASNARSSWCTHPTANRRRVSHIIVDAEAQVVGLFPWRSCARPSGTDRRCSCSEQRRQDDGQRQTLPD